MCTAHYVAVVFSVFLMVGTSAYTQSKCVEKYVYIVGNIFYACIHNIIHSKT